MIPTSLIAILASKGPIDCELRVQLVSHEQKETKENKPYVRMKFCDGSATTELSVWSDSPAFTLAMSMEKGAVYVVEGTFSAGKFGLETERGMGFSARRLEGDEREAVFGGPADLRQKQEDDWNKLWDIVRALPDGAMKVMASRLLDGQEAAYRRAGAARGNHHARRGGLVEHVSLMAQSADALCNVYSEIRRDVVIAAVVFHDAGKLMENQYEPQGFEMPFDIRGEAMGHIVIGICMARELWKAIEAKDLPGGVKDESLILHLCHCIAAHHGQLDWGSPVEPKSPEAQLLHFVDNIDAKLEMFRQQRKTAKQIAPGVFDGQRPLPKTLLFLA